MVPPKSTPAVHAVIRRRFTLLELLMAMALTIVVGFLVFKFFANMQTIWNASMSASNEHDDARLVLEFIATELQAARTQDEDQPGGAIRFHQPDGSSLWFVTAADPDGSSGSMTEVAYRLNGQDLQRAAVDQSSSTWNIYGDRDNADSQDGFRTIVDNVLALQFTCYDSNLSVVVPNQTTQLPAIITIQITVLDQREMKRWRQLSESQRSEFEKQFSRTFWKSVRLH